MLLVILHDIELLLLYNVAIMKVPDRLDRLDGVCTLAQRNLFYCSSLKSVTISAALCLLYNINITINNSYHKLPESSGFFESDSFSIESCGPVMMILVKMACTGLQTATTCSMYLCAFHRECCNS